MFKYSYSARVNQNEREQKIKLSKGNRQKIIWVLSWYILLIIIHAQLKEFFFYGCITIYFIFQLKKRRKKTNNFVQLKFELKEIVILLKFVCVIKIQFIDFNCLLSYVFQILVFPICYSHSFYYMFSVHSNSIHVTRLQLRINCFLQKIS